MGDISVLDTVDLSLEMDRKTYVKKTEPLRENIASLQRRLREAGIPLIFIVEGWEASGRGRLVNELINALDPRGYKVFFQEKLCRHEKRHPPLGWFWNRLPASGSIAFFSRSWYRFPMFSSFGSGGGDVQRVSVDEICDFEELLYRDGYVLIKIFLHVGCREQKKRLEKLKRDADRSWILSRKDLGQNDRYREVFSRVVEVLERTCTPGAPWEMVPARDWRWAAFRAFSIAERRMEEALAARKEPAAASPPPDEGPVPKSAGRLESLDLKRALSRKNYRSEIEKLQKQAGRLQVEAWRRGIPLIAVFQGWDAAGKGGAIKRLTRALDPRGYEVVPIGAPDEADKAHPWLWRFWRAFPEDGFMTFFDRSWYGRVLVERVEGLCLPAEWNRAYGEINGMEAQLVRYGTILLKFWLQIDPDEQLRRFSQRQADPFRQWKLTDEDWRNREKWDLYAGAVEEMLARTDRPGAPWTVVEANCKRYARVKVLRTFCERLAEKLED